MADFVCFRLDGTAKTLDVGPAPGEQAVFQRNDVEVTLETRLTSAGHASDDCLVVARVVREVEPDVYSEFEQGLGLIRGDALNPPRTEGKGKPAGPGTRWLFSPPAPVAALCEDVHHELYGAASHLVKLLRWLYNRPWPAQPLGSPGLQWSLDDAKWNMAPPHFTAPATFGGEGRELTGEGVEILGHLWREPGVYEPLARQVFLEAYALAADNPRAALVLAVAAAEVGVKQFAASQSDRDSEAWLIGKLPSPPIRVLLRDYMPFFTDKRTADGRAVPRHLQTSVHDAAEARNDIVHQGDRGYGEEQLADVLVAVNDLLCLLDWFAGNDWAFAHLQRETRAAYEP